MPRCVLAIDLGTSGCKAALVDYDGAVLAWEFAPVETILLPGGGAEQDPAAWWRAIVSSCRAVTDKARSLSAEIAAICANTQGEGTLPVDVDGKPLCNAILWMDTRGGPHVNKALGGRLAVAGYEPKKLVRYLRLTGGAPSLTGKDPAGHMLYLRAERPDIFERTHKFLNVLDYVNLRLTGRIVATVDSLLTSWVTDNRDPDRVTIDDALCAFIGVPRSMIPEPAPCASIVGTVGAAVAKELGVAKGTPVVAGSIDVTAAAVGAGTIADGDTHLYLGTSGWLGAHVPRKKTDLVSAIASVPCAVPSKFLMIALQATAGGNLTFLRDSVFFADDALGTGKAGPGFYAALDQLAESSPAGARGVIYTPWIYGERAPVENRAIRAGFHRLSLEHTRADLVRAVFEGIALNTRWILGPVERFLGRRCASIAAVGGGARSDVWCRIYADALDRPIRQIENPIEANVRGSAFMAAVALGEMTFADVPAKVRTRAVFEPTRAHRDVYDRHFREFKNLYSANKAIHRRLDEFHRGR